MAKISALIDKHRPCTLNTPDKVNILGIGINANINDKEGTKKVQPHTRKQKRQAKNQIISQQGYKTQ